MFEQNIRIDIRIEVTSICSIHENALDEMKPLSNYVASVNGLDFRDLILQLIVLINHFPVRILLFLLIAQDFYSFSVLLWASCTAIL